jgi:hypothetical protein
MRLDTPDSAHAKPGMAVVGEDLNDLEAKSKAFLHDLTSPAIKDAVKKNAAALYTLTKIEVKVGAILFAIAVAKEKGIAALGALGVAKEVFGAGSGFLSLPDDIKTFVRQFEQAMPSIGMASPDLYRAMSAGLDAMAAGAKLAVDLKKLGGV